MPDIQSVFGKIRVFEDFNGIGATASIADATAGTRFNDVCLIAQSGQTEIDHTVDESGGVVSFTGAGAAADGICIVSSPLQPSRNGTIVMEARFKNGSATDMRAWVGWQETVALAELVNPFTLSGTTLTSNDGGNAVGFYADTQATTDDFRFHASLDGAELTAAPIYVPGNLRGLSGQNTTTLGALGVRAGVTYTADSWYTARVEIDPSGEARGYFGHTSMAGAAGLQLICRLLPGTLDQTALMFPVLYLVAQSTGDPLHEIDYFGFTGNRDWAA